MRTHALAGMAFSLTCLPATGPLFPSCSVTVILAGVRLSPGMVRQSEMMDDFVGSTTPGTPVLLVKVTAGCCVSVTVPKLSVAVTVKVVVCATDDLTVKMAFPAASASIVQAGVQVTPPLGAPVSVTVTVLAGGTPPLLVRIVTVMVEEPVLIGVLVGLADAVDSDGLIAFGGGGATVTVAEAELLAVLVSPAVTPTETLFTRVPEPVTLTVRLKVVAPPPPASEPGFEQLTIAPTAPHDQPAPEADTNVMPAGKVSVTVRAPVLGAEPMFVT